MALTATSAATGAALGIWVGIPRTDLGLVRSSY